jgi:hypothetical protein
MVGGVPLWNNVEEPLLETLKLMEHHRVLCRPKSEFVQFWPIEQSSKPVRSGRSGGLSEGEGRFYYPAGFGLLHSQSD